MTYLFQHHHTLYEVPRRNPKRIRPTLLLFLSMLLFSVNALAATATTSIADIRRGDHVVLDGEVVRFADEDEFILRDETGSIRVYIGRESHARSAG